MITRDQLEVGKTYKSVGTDTRTVLYISEKYVFYSYKTKTEEDENFLSIETFCKTSSLPKKKGTCWTVVFKTVSGGIFTCSYPNEPNKRDVPNAIAIVEVPWEEGQGL